MRDEKSKFIESLRHFVNTEGADTPDGYGRTGYILARGELLLVEAIADYFASSDVPDSRDYDVWISDLPEYLVEAFVKFRTSPIWQVLRTKYRQATGEEIPDLTETHIGGLHRLSVCRDLAQLMPILVGQLRLRSRLDLCFHAQQMVIDHAWQRFVRVVYRNIMPKIANESHRGNCGTFGTTTLMTYAMAGRVMFTFSSNGDKDSISFVADDKDMYGNRSGPNVAAIPYATCVTMINEVTDNWDQDKFTKSDDIGPG